MILYYLFPMFCHCSRSCAIMSEEDSDKKQKKGEKFLNKANRNICYNARDCFWDCMKANNEDESKCVESRKPFEDHCPPMWVTHFDRKFQFEKFKKLEVEVGGDQMDKEDLKK